MISGKIQEDLGVCSTEFLEMSLKIPESGQKYFREWWMTLRIASKLCSTHSKANIKLFLECYFLKLFSLLYLMKQ